MRRTGLLESMARVDLDTLLEEVSARYRSGSLEALRAADPEWGADLDRTEAEVGALYEALREADRTLGRWRQTLAELHRLWMRVGEVRAESAGDESGVLEEVA